MTKKYKIDAVNGFAIPQNEVDKVRKIGYNLWIDYFLNVENAQKEEAKDLATKAQLTFAIRPSPETRERGLSQKQKKYLFD